jgi:HrpA-like RNA helicase
MKPFQDFFSLGPPRHDYSGPKPNRVIPKPEPKLPNHDVWREECGTEYTKKYKDKISLELSKVNVKHSTDNFKQLLTKTNTSLQAFTSFNISTLTEIVLDDTQATRSELNRTMTAMKHRNDLPIFGFRENIIQKITESPVVIITGSTGCGKVKML